jgi:hypothetical protein
VVPFPWIVVAMAMTRWKQMRLHSNCHPGGWDASGQEISFIAEYLGEPWIESCLRLLARQLTTPPEDLSGSIVMNKSPSGRAERSSITKRSLGPSLTAEPTLQSNSSYIRRANRTLH